MRAGQHAQRVGGHVLAPLQVVLKLDQLVPQVGHGAVVESERGPVVMILVKLPFIVRPHVPDRPRRMRKQQANGGSLCLGKELN